MPGIIATNDDRKILRKILIPVDGTPESQSSLVWYVNNMKRKGDLVIFLHVVIPVLPSALSGLSKESESMPAGSAYYVPEKNMHAAQTVCQHLIHEAHRYAVTSEACIQVDTKPGPAILKIIREQNIDNVIMFKRNLGFFKRAINGSVSSYVMNNSNVAVSIVSSMHN